MDIHQQTVGPDATTGLVFVAYLVGTADAVSERHIGILRHEQTGIIVHGQE